MDPGNPDPAACASAVEPSMAQVFPKENCVVPTPGKQIPLKEPVITRQPKAPLPMRMFSGIPNHTLPESWTLPAWSTQCRDPAAASCFTRSSYQGSMPCPAHH